MSYDKAQLANLLANNPDLKIADTSFLNVPKQQGKASNKPASTIRPIETAKPSLAHSGRSVVILMDYPGCVITEDNCYYRNGTHTFMKLEARDWQEELVEKIMICGVTDWKAPLKVSITGVFLSVSKSCDIHNLKIVFDSIQKATGLNDKFYITETYPGKIDKTQTPTIIITVSEV
jgi:hypothetical protein